VTRKRIGDGKTGGMHRAWVFTANMQACVHPSPHGRYSSSMGRRRGSTSPATPAATPAPIDLSPEPMPSSASLNVHKVTTECAQSHHGPTVQLSRWHYKASDAGMLCDAYKRRDERKRAEAVWRCAHTWVHSGNAGCCMATPWYCSARCAQSGPGGHYYGVRYGTLEYASNHLGSSSSCMSLNWSISLCRFIACSHLDRATCPAPPDEAMCRWNVPPHHRW
jgi:hypothetical protein